MLTSTGGTQSRTTRFIERVTANVPEAYWQRVIEVADRINAGENDEIVIGTARKAICLLDALSQFGLVRPDKKLLSSRIVGIDPGCLKSRNVLVVEDLITSTRTLRSVMSGINATGPSNLSSISFAMNSDYETTFDFMVEDLDRTLMLSDTAAGEFGASLLDMLTLAARSYNVDWPLLHSASNVDAFVNAACSMPGWTFLETSNKLQLRHGSRAFTFYPDSIACVEEIASVVAIPKVRALISEGRRQTLQLIPIVALADVNQEFERLVLAKCADLPDGPHAIQAYAQHRLSLDLARKFVNELNAWSGHRLRVRESTRTLQMCYGERLAEIIRRPVAVHPADAPIGSWLVTTPSAPRHVASVQVPDPALASECEILLSAAFFDYYAMTGEKAMRERARVGDGTANAELVKTEALLHTGLSIADLEEVLRERGYDEPTAKAGVSTFLDKAIDTGLVVPVFTAVGRRFRPGEAAMFNNKAKRLCEVLLTRLGELRDGTASQILVQKALVSLWKFGTYTSILDRTGQDQLVSVQYYQHGAVLNAGSRPKVSNGGNFIVTSVLESVGTLEHVKKTGYRIRSLNAFEPTEETHETSVSTLASMIHLITHRTSAPSKDEENFVLWVSTADQRQAPTALAADISLSLEEFTDTSNAILSHLAHHRPADATVEKARRLNWHTALNSGYQKSIWIERGGNEAYERSLKDVTDDVFKADFLARFVESVRQPSMSRLAIKLTRDASEWLISTRLLWQVLAWQVLGQKELKRLTEYLQDAESYIVSVDHWGPKAILPHIVRLAKQLLNGEAFEIDSVRKTIWRLRTQGMQIVDAVDVATGDDGRIDSYESFSSAALIYARRHIPDDVYANDLRTIRGRTQIHDAEVIDISTALGIPSTFALAARGANGASLVEHVAANLVCRNPRRYRQAIIVKNLRSDYEIGQSTISSKVVCNTFRELAQELDESPTQSAVEYLTSRSEIPKDVVIKSLDGVRFPLSKVYDHEGPGGFTRSGFDLNTRRASRDEITQKGKNKMRPPDSSKKNSRQQMQTADILLLAPLPVEQAALLNVFSLQPTYDDWIRNDVSAPMYRMVAESRNGRSFDAVVLFPTAKGPDSARDIVARALDLIDPRFILVCGIAGALEDELEFGDVVVAEQILPYSYRKEMDDRTEVTSMPTLQVAPESRNAFTNLQISPVDVKRLDGSSGVVKCGTIASGDTVLRSKLGDVRQYLIRQSPSPSAVETESAAVLKELCSRGANTVGRAIVVRGVSDKADAKKGDDFHHLAAENAAMVAHALTDYLPWGSSNESATD